MRWKQNARARHAERQERWGIQDEKNRLAQQQRECNLAATAPADGRCSVGKHQRNVDFVNAVEGRLRGGSVSPEEQENAERWLSWASERLKAVDPIGELLRNAWTRARCEHRQQCRGIGIDPGTGIDQAQSAV